MAYMDREYCLFEESKHCEDCGECERCDLEPAKVCDNCEKCLQTEASFRGIEIEKIVMEPEETTKSS